MRRKIPLRLVPVLAAACLGLAPTAGCSRKEESKVEKLGEKAKDALDVREHEKLKDAGEEAKDALKDAGEAVKDEAETLKEKAK